MKITLNLGETDITIERPSELVVMTLTDQVGESWAVHMTESQTTDLAESLQRALTWWDTRTRSVSGD